MQRGNRGGNATDAWAARLEPGKPVTVSVARAEIEAVLTAAGVPTPDVDARLLVGHALGWSAGWMRVAGGEPLPAEAAVTLAGFTERRAAREPLQLILGTVGFRALELEVRPGVFIPRPETEVLAGEAIARAPENGVVVEPCTGAGVVACAVAHERRSVRIWATDRSPAAVWLARRNVERAGVEVEVGEGDLLDPVPDLLGRLDVVVSNPPYLAEGELAAVEPEVAAWDPPEALVAGPTGHEVSDRLIAAAPAWLLPGGWLLLEVAETRAGETARRCRAAGLVSVDVVADLAGRERVVVARRVG